MAKPYQHFFYLKVVGGKKGGSAVYSAAYLYGTSFLSEYFGEIYNRSDKENEVVYTHIFAPEGSPGWVYDPYKLTNSIEQAETRKDAQFMRSMYFTLPLTMTHEQHVALVNDYAQHFVSMGMIVICAIHNTKNNPNAHFLLTMRQLSKEGMWLPKSYDVPLLNEHGEKIKRGKGKTSGKYKTQKIFTTDWNNQGNCAKWRTLYQDKANRHLEQEGSTERIDLRSYEKQGINKIPQVRYSQTELLLKQQGIGTECEAINKIIEAENTLRELEDRKISERRVMVEQEITLLKAKFAKRRKFRWKPSPQRQALQEFWSELHEKESQLTLALAHVWQRFKEEAHSFFQDAPVCVLSHHDRTEGRKNTVHSYQSQDGAFVKN